MRRRATRALLALALGAVCGCAGQQRQADADGASRHSDREAASAPAATQPTARFDTTLARPVAARDWLERITKQRGLDFKLIDWLFDAGTEPPAFDRAPLPARGEGVRISRDVALLDDRDPFPDEPPLPPKDVTIHVAVLRSSFKTREQGEVLAAAQPFIDLAQREVNVRGAPSIYEAPDDAFHALRDGRDQMAIGHVFDYLLIRSWMEGEPNNGTVLLGYAEPAHPYTGELDRDFPGVPGTSIVLVVAADSPFRSLADLRGKRLAVCANDTRGPGTFLTALLREAGQAKDQPFFGGVALRRYRKDAVIDVLKGKADAACVDQGTLGALLRFYGGNVGLRTIAVSPRYDMSVLFATVNNLATHRTEIELTQRQLTTLTKDPEGQEVLFFFDLAVWQYHREGDIDVPRQHFADFVRFISETPVDLMPLLDPKAPVDRQTYDRLGDE